METITYEVKNGLYLNITNRCPCSCTFCIRNNDDHVYGSEPLWLDHEPSVSEICDAIDQKDLASYEEVVFCGYGEPTERLDALLEVAAYIKKKSPIRIRVNTNGLSDLIHGEKTAPKLKGLIDVVSISLNATNPEDYLKMVRPKFGIGSFDAMLSFAKDCTAYVPDVVMTIVDTVTTKEEQEKSLQICNDLSVRLRIREYEG
ncbi:MAG: TIGR04100 family radical SAM protein [Lachnospiraceae bacterium]|nr:TIGR04100 family radical SAM protein [Lachnospiraceae bacterium]MBR7075485.1 TIGR04100 family radical SAM protein [Lachnospiraceae bacterium]